VAALSYDAAGGLTNVSTVGSLAYDARHRVGQATIGALVTSYGVNALGQRVAKNGPASGQVEYVYDLSGRLLGAYGANGAAQEEIVWLGSLPVATLHGGAVYYIAPDHLGAPHQIVNSANQQVWFWDHDLSARARRRRRRALRIICASRARFSIPRQAFATTASETIPPRWGAMSRATPSASREG